MQYDKMEQDRLIELHQQCNPVSGTNNMETLLFEASKEKDPERINIILSRGQNPNVQDEDGNSPLHLVNILKCCCKACIENAESCCAVLLNSPNINFDIRNNQGLTPLHLAAQYQLERSLQDLINKGADVYIRSRSGVEAIKVIANKTPDVMCKILDKAVFVQNGHPRSEDCVVNVDFRPVTLHKTCLIEEPLYGNELQFLRYILSSNPTSREKILRHPVTGVFLHQKWRQARYQIYISIIISLLWLLFYTGYVIRIYLVMCPCDLFNMGKSSSKKVESNRTANVETCKEALKPEATFVLILVVTLLKMIYLLGEMITRRRFTNLNIATIVILCMAFGTTYPTLAKQERIEGMQYELAALTTFLVWASSLSIFGKFPSVGLYLEMFGHVLRRFWGILPAFMFLFLAFALAFCILFPQELPYSLFPMALLKVLVMMVGEMDYEDTFYGEEEKSVSPITGHILYAAFVIVVAIVLMNLLIGLTVADIQILQQKAELTRISRQVAEMHHLESIIHYKRVPEIIKGIIQSYSSVSRTLEKGVFSFRLNDRKDKTVPESLKAAVLPLVTRLHDERKSTVCQRRPRYEVYPSITAGQPPDNNFPAVQVIGTATVKYVVP